MSAPGSRCPLRRTALWPQVGAFLMLEPFCQLILLHADKGTGEFNIRYFFLIYLGWGFISKMYKLDYGQKYQLVCCLQETWP